MARLSDVFYPLVLFYRLAQSAILVILPFFCTLIGFALSRDCRIITYTKGSPSMIASQLGCEARVCFDDLPDEVLQHILYYLSTHDVLSRLQRVSKRLHRLGSEPLLWRHHCRAEYKYWDSKHSMRRKNIGSVGDVDWKTIFIHRKKIDRETTKILDSIIGGQTNRIQKFKAIADFGYDAKDSLLYHCHTSEAAEDVLARRYYANAVLDHIHRSKALAEWWKLVKGEHVPLERALGSFDLFVLHDQPGDLNEISEMFDALAKQLRSECPNIDSTSTRRKACEIVGFLRRHNLTGLSSETAYRDLQNNYIGIALQDPDHPSLPPISVAIFCALAQRFAVDARCCGIPNHVHAMVFPPENESLDGNAAVEGAQSEPMYLDPYRSDVEVPIQNLKSMLTDWGIQTIDHDRFLVNSTPINIVLRTSRNIVATVHEFRGHGGIAGHARHPTVRLHANPFADMDNAFYSALWANFVFGHPMPLSQGGNQRQIIPLVLETFERLYPMDASLIEQYICPLFNNPSIVEHWELHEALRVVRVADQTPKQIRQRTMEASRNGVKYRVGQVFRHKRYSYSAVITGWDIECGMDSNWIAVNDVDSLSRGRHQSFYHALVDDTSIRYVAEENIEIIEPEVPVPLMSLAGRFFKRWDKQKRVFVSNISDEYPED